MELPRRTTYLLVFGLALLNLAIRFPRAPHESGVDSFVWHGMAQSLTEHGVALYVLNPLSYVGLYPLSHPSGSVFWTSGLGVASSLPLEWSIYLLNLAVSLVGLLGAFLLAREFWKNEVFCLSVALLFSTAPEFIISLLWQMPTRIVFTALIPFFLWCLLRMHRTGRTSFLFLAGTILLLMMTFHRLTILMAIVIMAYIVTYMLLVVLRVIRLRLPRVLLDPTWRKRTPYIALATFIGLAIVVILYTGILDEYSTGQLGSRDDLTTQIMNLSASLVRSAGLLMPLMLVGIVTITQRKNKALREPLLLIILLSFIPTLILRKYTGYYTIPLTSLFIGFGLMAILLRMRRRRAVLVVSIAVAAFIVVSSVQIVEFELYEDRNLSSETYDTALYVSDRVNGTMVSNDGLRGSRISAISGQAYLPIGGATTAFQSPELLTFGFVDPADLQILQVPLMELTVESDSPFVLRGIQGEADWAGILSSHVNDLPRAYDAYGVTHLYEFKRFYSGFTAYGNLYSSKLAESAHVYRYKVYESSTEIIWFLR